MVIKRTKVANHDKLKMTALICSMCMLLIQLVLCGLLYTAVYNYYPYCFVLTVQQWLGFLSWTVRFICVQCYISCHVSLNTSWIDNIQNRWLQKLVVQIINLPDKILPNFMIPPEFSIPKWYINLSVASCHLHASFSSVDHNSILWQVNWWPKSSHVMRLIATEL